MSDVTKKKKQSRAAADLLAPGGGNKRKKSKVYGTSTRVDMQQMIGSWEKRKVEPSKSGEEKKATMPESKESQDAIAAFRALMRNNKHKRHELVTLLRSRPKFVLGSSKKTTSIEIEILFERSNHKANNVLGIHCDMRCESFNRVHGKKKTLIRICARKAKLIQAITGALKKGQRFRSVPVICDAIAKMCVANQIQSNGQYKLNFFIGDCHHKLDRKPKRKKEDEEESAAVAKKAKKSKK